MLLHQSQYDSGFRGFQEVHSPVPTHDNQCSQQDSIKLPKIKLPTFNDDITKWRYFRNLVFDL